jgi:homoserine dehydrogenase
MKLALIGFGVVGQGLAEILRDKVDELRQQYDFTGEIVAVATRNHGSLYHPDGLDTANLLKTIQQGHLDYYPDIADLSRNWDVDTLVRQSNADVVIETTLTNLLTGQPALNTCYAAFDSGKHVVLANKGPVAVAYADLKERARRAGKRLLFEGTVMAGTPSLRLAREALAGCRISEARGIVNGTTNYILTQMEAGMNYADALASAQALGYAEADPTADVDGWDAAGKVIILAAALFNTRLTLKDIRVKGISEITPQEIQEAAAAGERWKLIARVTPDNASVQPTRIPTSNPLAAVSGATNAITFATDLLGDVTLVGPGAGRLQTGFALLSDLLDIHRGSQ